MAILLSALESRRDQLVLTLQSSEASYTDLKERCKVIKKEIANINGALLELDRLIDNEE